MTRDEIFIKIITTLNERKEQGCRKLFDCGELGFVFITWAYSRWEAEWLTPIVWGES